jgi:hypothetical protein
VSRSLGAALLVMTCLVAVPDVASSQTGTAQTGTAQNRNAQTGPDDIPQRVRSPKAALLRASVFPGWGQVYNRHYLKVPILYAGIGALAVSAIQANKDYVLYRNAFQYKAFQAITDEGEVNPAAQFQADYDELAAALGPIASPSLERHRDKLRRNRDLSILGIGVIWGLGVLDAYVSAHLSSFDVGEDLTLRVTPRLAPGFAPTSQGNVALTDPGLSLILSW